MKPLRSRFPAPSATKAPPLHTSRIAPPRAMIACSTSTRKLQMDVVDPVAPTAHALERVATAEDEAAGVEGEAHVGAGEE